MLNRFGNTSLFRFLIIPRFKDFAFKRGIVYCESSRLFFSISTLMFRHLSPSWRFRQHTAAEKQTASGLAIVLSSLI